MNSESMNVIINELRDRIRDARNTDNHEVVFELENLIDWLIEEFIF